MHGFQVSAPAEWTVLSNCPPEVVLDRDDGGRLRIFEDTPRLSTYVVVVNAGPFHELREQRGEHASASCRQSLRPFLERDAEELFRVTEQGLAFFEERFAQPFPQERSTRRSCPTWAEPWRTRGRDVDRQRAVAHAPDLRAAPAGGDLVLLHEMAHMWFGDLVTMRWWDDIWLNEAFASSRPPGVGVGHGVLRRLGQLPHRPGSAT